MSPCLSGEHTGGKSEQNRMEEEKKPTYHDAEESFLLDIPSVVFVNLDYLLDSCTDRNEKPSRPSQLINQLLWNRRCGRSNVNAVVRASRRITFGWG